ncbi:orotate phosphoribosyltransferase [Leadbetterella byssophila DSM 17132]|uniref:Orotate phosphoribosyltransferase n=1 Tax=Leadbetterella byssophila (strain DSM 17132 / JCM 16389 / KACC 11308 / NBRC 106382 / 4M15) TaxID=649349 RepID=E4RS22_LEAB4|nr:orotate phosphoribosyltransferase [Leadbetterella byssophila]ADQ15838.1 orotate phosphoribosyltransferase [Leadbetterella byssophila DSM 17132]
MNTARKIASFLLETQAVKLSPQKPFKWSSGWNSPIYCDNRITLSHTEARTFIKKALAKAIKKHFPEATMIAGVATAGIAQGALVADYLQMPFAYVRPKPKDHGMGNQIEGRIPEGSKVVVLEDLISTGGSSIKAAEALQAQGVEVLGMAAIFTYGFKTADKNFEVKNLKLVTLSNYSYLIDEALKQNYISAEDIDLLKKWRRQPDKF